MTLREHLSVPYLVVAEAVEDGTGKWLRRAAHPELPDCWAAAPDIEATMERLQRRRVAVILDLLRRGLTVPVPRPPLQDVDVEGLLASQELRLLIPLLDERNAMLTAGARGGSNAFSRGQ